MKIENKRTAAVESANSPQPAQVKRAPTQRHSSHRREIVYTIFIGKARKCCFNLSYSDSRVELKALHGSFIFKSYYGGSEYEHERHHPARVPDRSAGQDLPEH